MSLRINSLLYRIEEYLSNFSDEELKEMNCVDIYENFSESRFYTLKEYVHRYKKERNIRHLTNEELEQMRKSSYGMYKHRMKLFNMEDDIKEKIVVLGSTMKIIEKLKENPDGISHEKACVLVSCNPSVKLFNEEIYIAYPYLNKEKTIKTIKEIEKRLFKLNVYRTISVKVGTAIYLSNFISLRETTDIMKDFGKSFDVSIRDIKKITGLDKRNKISRVSYLKNQN